MRTKGEKTEQGCACGAGFRTRQKVLHITPHAMDCLVLKQIVATEKRGICSQCGAKKQRGTSWDGDMQMVVESERCPNGHGYGMSWRPPTKADIRKAIGAFANPTAGRFRPSDCS